MWIRDEDMKLYYISDKAYDKLVVFAIQQRYVKPAALKKRGMSEFLNDLCYMKFEDTRPDNVKQNHQIMINAHRAPIWTLYPVRRTRALYLSQPTINRYMKLALQVGIIKEEPWTIGGPSRTNPVSVISYVFEGLGLGWITPEKWPIKRISLE